MDVKTQTEAANNQATTNDTEEGESWLSFLWFLVKLVILVVLFRSFVFSPFSIPSESMLPKLWNGDYLLAAKWPYGYSENSFDFPTPDIDGRLLASQPERGDIVIFKHPIDGSDYIKRVIGLPGDTIGMVGGQIVLNGELVPKERIEDFILPTSPNTGCARARYRVQNADGETVCEYPRFRETLPNGVSYDVLDYGISDADSYPQRIVPEGQMFVLGDNRDNSQDSRYPAMTDGGVGLVPLNNLVGRASIIMWSTDGGAEWYKPWTWFTAARGDRLGNTL